MITFSLTTSPQIHHRLNSIRYVPSVVRVHVLRTDPAPALRALSVDSPATQLACSALGSTAPSEARAHCALALPSVYSLLGQRACSMRLRRTACEFGPRELSCAALVKVWPWYTESIVKPSTPRAGSALRQLPNSVPQAWRLPICVRGNCNSVRALLAGKTRLPSILLHSTRN